MPIVIIVVVVIALIAGVTFIFTGSNTGEPTDSAPIETGTDVDLGRNDTQTPEAPTTNNENNTDTPPATVSSTYADGTYRATATYFTPRNTEHEIEVVLTVADDVVTSAEVLYDGSTNAVTPSHQRFDSAYTGEVVGVSLDNVSLSRTGGASLTSEAFNDAVTTIKSEADA